MVKEKTNEFVLAGVHSSHPQCLTINKCKCYMGNVCMFFCYRDNVEWDCEQEAAALKIVTENASVQLSEEIQGANRLLLLNESDSGKKLK